MDINTLRYFAAIYELESFAQAASRLGVSKSTLSRKIAELETDLGVQLLHRSTRNLTVTEAGEQIYPHARRLQEEYEQIGSLANSSREEARGTLRITAPVTLGRITLGPWIQEFAQRYPDIELDIRLSDQFEHLIDSQIDIAIRVGRLDDSSLISRKLVTGHRALFAAPHYLDGAKLRRPDELGQHRYLALKTERVSSTRLLLYKQGRSKSFHLTPAITVNDMLSLVEMVKSGAGIALMPIFAIQGEIETGRLERVLPDYRGEDAEFYLVYYKRTNLPMKIRVFIEFISHKFQQDTRFR